MSRARGSVFGDYIRQGLKQAEQAVGEAVAAHNERTALIREQYKDKPKTLPVAPTSPPEDWIRAMAEQELARVKAEQAVVEAAKAWHQARHSLPFKGSKYLSTTQELELAVKALKGLEEALDG